MPDYIARGGAIMFYALPGFWIGTLVLVFGGRWFGWAPPIAYVEPWVDPWGNFKHVITPMLILGLSPIGIQIRLIRTQVLEVMRQDYVRTARAKGLGPRSVYSRHILRNALLPFVTVIGLALPGVVGGTVIFEQIFLVPGVGRYLLESLTRLDLYVVMATNLFFGALLVFANIIVDVELRSDRPTGPIDRALAVVSRDVVDTADRGFASDRGVATVVVVAVQPWFEGGCAFGLTAVDADVGPLLGHRAVEALDLAVGLRPVGPSPLRADAGGAAGSAEQIAAVGAAIVGEHSPHLDAALRRTRRERARGRRRR